MRGAIRCSVPEYCILLKGIDRRIESINIGGVGRNVSRIAGDIGGVGCHVIVSSFQLRAINRVSTVIRKGASFHISDGAGGFRTMSGVECSAVPEHSILFKSIHRRVQAIYACGVSRDISGIGSNVGSVTCNIAGVGRNVGSVIGNITGVGSNVGSVIGNITGVSGNVSRVASDIGGVGRHVIVSVFQLRAINRVSTVIRKGTSFHVGDGAGGFRTMSGVECSAIPEQGIIFKVANSICQISDIGGVGSNICSVSCNISGIGSDIGGIGLNIIIGGFQL